MNRVLGPLFDLEGKTALITGGSRGLGLSMARSLGLAGARVIVSARKADELQEAVRLLQSEDIDAIGITSDLSDAPTLTPLVDQVLESRGQIDVLVNNAGVTWAAPAEELTADAWKRVVDVNLNGTWALTQQVAVRSMIPRRTGAIIVTASTAGLYGNRPGSVSMVAYNTTKAAQINMVRALAGEWGRFGVRVNAILPGWFPTKLTEKTLERNGEDFAAGVPLQRLGQPEDLMGPVLFLASDASRFVTGHALTVDGGMTAVH